MMELALKIVEYAFIDKKDLVGAPYIDHIKRVADRLKNKSKDIQTVALLHDLLEDCPEWNKKVLGCFFYEEIVDAVESITRRENEAYNNYINRVSLNRYATVVKIADLQDNMDMTRLKEITDKDIIRLKKYLSSYQFLTEEIK